MSKECFVYHFVKYFSLFSIRFSSDQVIFHPGAIRIMMTLLPHVFSPEDPQVCCRSRWSSCCLSLMALRY